MTLVEAVLAPVVAVAAAAGVRRSIEGERKDRWHRWPFELLRLRLVAFRALGVGYFEIHCLMLGIRGRAFAGCIFEMALSIQSVWVLFGEVERPTFTSSHAASLRILSPTSLKPSLVSSNRSDTRSRTRSVSRFVPRRLICCDSREIEEVRLKSWTERFSAKLLNSWSSRVSGSSRYSGGCASSWPSWLNDIVGTDLGCTAAWDAR